MNYRLICADVMGALRELPDESVQCVVTSPPYWGLRDYGIAGQLGLERTPEEYTAKMVAVFREVRRVLRKDGTLWLNVGDTHCAQPSGSKPGDFSASSLTNPAYQEAKRPRVVDATTKQATHKAPDFTAPHRGKLIGYKPKDLIGIPWMLAFALRADGLYLRSDIIWSKPNPMPESVTDRPTRAHEYLFLLSKSRSYFYDAAAIAEPGVSAGTTKMPDGWDTGEGAHSAFHRNGREKGRRTDKQRGHSWRHAGFNDRWDTMEREQQCVGMRNKRSVWTIATEPFRGAHFATFPTALVEPCILAGSKVGDIILDPFSGSGTTGVVALSHQRDFIGIDLNPKYVEMARRRLGTVAPMFAEERV